MSTDIVKKEGSDLAPISEAMIVNDQEIKIGECLVNRHGDDIYEVIGFEYHGDSLFVIVKRGSLGEHSISERDIKEYYTVISGVSFDDIEKSAEAIMSGKISIRQFDVKEQKDEAGLMVVNTQMYLDKLAQLKKKEREIIAIKAMVVKKTDAIRSKINGVITKYQGVITKLNKIIFTLELYAGIEESIKQIQDGPKASDEEPIHLMQLMKFMDEEVGDPSNGGISYDTIEQFDEWLLSYNKHLGYHNYKLLIPYNKGVRIMRVRRKASEKYSRDIFNNRFYIDKEMQTYVIIRNGESFYTISSKMHFSEKLFPDTEELEAFYEKANKDEALWHEDEKIEHYKHGMILMQGLIDRTEVFGNLYGKVSFLKSTSSEKGDVVFEYESEDNLITDGSKTFLDFLDTSTIQAGDRIIAYNPPKHGRYDKRLKKWYQNEYAIPEAPDSGIYKLEFDPEEKSLYFKYKPDEKVYTSTGYHDRKNSLWYLVKPNDSFIVNIDIVSHRNIDWIENMMYDRRDRKNYLRVAGLLFAIKHYKREELNKEDPFKSLVMAVCKVDELTALDAIHWWKTKNKHKRSLFIDDQKALRMIAKELRDKTA